MNAHDLHVAFVRCLSRKVITASEANAHLRASGWDDSWEAFRASKVGNWYSFTAALRGKAGHQATLRLILSIPAKSPDFEEPIIIAATPSAQGEPLPLHLR